MEENQPSLQQINNVEDSNSDEFYEKIEAPKFVDFTVPDLDRYRPDDRYWFCSRVGCDQKHEEELDSEAIYKNFVLRVMEARSPNVRLRKTLSSKCSSANAKCPQSAPAKSSKTRVSRLAVISSISHKIGDAKVKVRPIVKAIATPNARAKQSSVASKALTTPRNKKCIPYPNSFQSAQNAKATTIVVPKNRVTAKALVFSSPKKVVRTEFSLGVDTSVRKVCEGMKKLEITSQSKRILGYSPKSSKGFRRDLNKPLPLKASSKQLGARKVKIQAEEKSSKHLKEKRKEENLEKSRDFVHPEGVHNDSSDMEIDAKSRNCSLEVHSLCGSSKSNGGNGHEELSETVNTLDNLRSTNPPQEKAIPSLERLPSEEISNAGIPNASRGDMDSVLCRAERDTDTHENSNLKLQALNGESNGGMEQIEREQKIKSSLEDGKVSEDETPDYQTSEGAGHDSDDKENALVPDDNRELNINNGLSGMKLLGRDKTCENDRKNTRTTNKTLEKGLTSTAKDVQGVVKYKKPKPTNPKPFRLRTDERGILKEANMEKKLHLLVLPKETATFLKFPITNSLRRHENDIHRNEKFPGQSQYKNDTNEGREKELQKTTQKNQLQVRTARVIANKKEVDIKTVRMIPERRRTVLTKNKPKVVSSPSECGKDCVLQRSESSSRKTKSYRLQQQLVRPQGANSTRKAMVSLRKPGQLGVIEETSVKLRSSKTAAIPAARAPSSTPYRSSSRRKPTTIPREPSIHSIHTLKSGTRKLA